MDAYIFKADLLCAPCAENARQTLQTAPGWTFDPEEGTWMAPDERTPEGLQKGRPCVFDVEGNVLDERGLAMNATDTDTFPAGPTAEGGGESDSPAHCAECHLFLENPLARDGIEYVAGTVLRDLRGGLYSSLALKTWAPFYRDDLSGTGIITALDLGAAVAELDEALSQEPALADLKVADWQGPIGKALAALKAEAQDLARSVEI